MVVAGRCLIGWSRLEHRRGKEPLGESYGSNEPVCVPIGLDQQLRDVGLAANRFARSSVLAEAAADGSRVSDLLVTPVLRIEVVPVPAMERQSQRFRSCSGPTAAATRGKRE